MRRMPTRRMSPTRLAKELAARVGELGGGEAAVLAVFGRFVAADDERLRALVQRMPVEASALWSQALEPFDAPDSWLDSHRESVLAEIRRTALPVLPEGHLFELLLRKLDASGRRRRGAYFTPRPLVEYVVRTAARLASEQFAGRPCHLIDPACGYGAFLAEAARARPLVAALQAGARPLVAAMQWMTGIELCRTTWAVAHLLLSLAPSPQPLAPHLLNANPLVAGESLREAILGPAGEPLVPVIVGNPPWANFGRQNRSPWIDGLLADYRSGLAERKSNLADDAIKFLRWGQHWIDEAGAGLLAFVTPNTWLSGLTHRRMRLSLLESFDELHVLDLHGQAGGPAGDENVFGIRSGVAVVVMVKRQREVAGDGAGAGHGQIRVLSSQYPVLRTADIPSKVQRMDITGSRAAKFTQLADLQLTSGETVALAPSEPDWSLGTARGCSNSPRHASAYATFWPLNRIVRQYISGVQTKNDAVFVGFTRQAVARQVRAWLAERGEPAQFDAGQIRPYLVAPFDRRWIYYDPGLLGRARHSVMRHMLRPNLGLVFMRQATGRGEYDHFLAVDCLVSDRVFYSRHGAPFLAPLWNQGSGVRGQESGDRRQGTGYEQCVDENSVLSTEYSVPDSNFEPRFIEAMFAAIDTACEPLAVFHYLYGLAYSPAYRRTFDNELRRGFPRFPLPRGRDWFERLADLGEQLVDLHVNGASPAADEAQATAEPFRVGGYDVLRRWRLPRTRRGEAIDEAELARLARIGRETRRVMQEIDALQSPNQWSG